MQDSIYGWLLATFKNSRRQYERKNAFLKTMKKKKKKERKKERKESPEAAKSQRFVLSSKLIVVRLTWPEVVKKVTIMRNEGTDPACGI